jgi:hypothetical protein
MSGVHATLAPALMAVDPGFEPFFYLHEIAAMAKGAYTVEALRAACYRAPEHNRLDHIRCGGKRPHIKVRWSDFVAWVERERAQ